jgi:hypothetical protein
MKNDGFLLGAVLGGAAVLFGIAIGRWMERNPTR